MFLGTLRTSAETSAVQSMEKEHMELDALSRTDDGEREGEGSDVSEKNKAQTNTRVSHISKLQTIVRSYSTQTTLYNI